MVVLRIRIRQLMSLAKLFILRPFIQHNFTQTRVTQDKAQLFLLIGETIEQTGLFLLLRLTMVMGQI